MECFLRAACTLYCLLPFLCKTHVGKISLEGVIWLPVGKNKMGVRKRREGDYSCVYVLCTFEPRNVEVYYVQKKKNKSVAVQGNFLTERTASHTMLNHIEVIGYKI